MPSIDPIAPGLDPDELSSEHEATGETSPRRLTRSERPSRTLRKQASHELQDLGAELVKLPADRLALLPMSDELRTAIADHQRTRSFEGRRRQMQYIGKLMHRNDPEPLREAVLAMRLGTAKASLALHQIERWRAQLLASDDSFTAWMSDHPSTDSQALRALIRSARKDAAAAPEQRSGRAFRELFQVLKQHLEAQAQGVAARESR